MGDIRERSEWHEWARVFEVLADYLVWCLSFLMVWALVVFGIPGSALAIGVYFDLYEHPLVFAQKSWEWLFMWSYSSGLPGAFLVGFIAPRALRDPAHTRPIMLVSASVPPAVNVLTLATRSWEAGSLDVSGWLPALLIVGTLFGVPLFLLSYFGVREANLMLARFRCWTASVRVAILVLSVSLVIGYFGAYFRLRDRGEIEMKRHSGMTRDGSVWTEVHAETGSPYWNWFFWLAGELEVDFMNPTVPPFVPDGL